VLFYFSDNKKKFTGSKKNLAIVKKRKI